MTVLGLRYEIAQEKEKQAMANKLHTDFRVSENKFVMRSEFGETVTYEPPHDKDCLPPSHSLILLLLELIHFRMAHFPSEESAILLVKLREAQEWLKVK